MPWWTKGRHVRLWTFIAFKPTCNYVYLLSIACKLSMMCTFNDFQLVIHGHMIRPGGVLILNMNCTQRHFSHFPCQLCRPSSLSFKFVCLLIFSWDLSQYGRCQQENNTWNLHTHICIYRYNWTSTLYNITSWLYMNISLPVIVSSKMCVQMCHTTIQSTRTILPLHRSPDTINPWKSMVNPSRGCWGYVV